MTLPQDWDLKERSDLPDSLRILSQHYPREGWAAHPNFEGLTKFWLDRHMMFRDVQARLQQESESFLDGGMEARQYGAHLHRLAGFLINELHGHHHMEDAHYFPMLTAKEPRLVQAFELLDSDHHAMEALLQKLTDDTNGALRALGTEASPREAVARFHGAVIAFRNFLDRHLTDEEEIVVPVILEHGGA